MNRKLLASLSVFALLLTIYSSCTRIDTTDIGNGLIPAVDNVNTFETFLAVDTDNRLFNDSSRVYDDEDHALGTIAADPVFGSISGGIYFNVSPAVFGSYPFIPKDSVKFPIDSVVLSLSYKGVYGDTLSTQNFNVYRLAEDVRFKDSTLGYQIGSPDINTAGLLTNHSQNFDRLNDNYVIRNGRDTATITNQMRIRLPVAFGEELINSDAGVFANDTTFRQRFPGFAILPAAGGNQTALAYFNLRSTDTKLTIHYKAKSMNGVVDSQLVTSFTFINYRNLNKITRQFAGSEYGTAMNPGTPSDPQLYIASSPGSYATVKVKGLDTFMTTNRVIHKAELMIDPVPAAGRPPYQEPYYLFLDAWDSVANIPKTIQNDFTYNSSSQQYNQTLFGGFLRNGKYSFDISRYIQGLVTRKETINTLRVYAPYKTATAYIPAGTQASVNVITADTTGKNQNSMLYLNPQIAYGRTVLAGGNHPTKPMRLRIIYSRL